MADQGPPQELIPSAPLRAVWFDCDSTLSTIEGIDELGALRHDSVRQEVSRLTDRAMAGELGLADVYGERLRLIAPTRAECARIGALYVERMVPDARLVILALRTLGKVVGIVSGGLRTPVLQLAEELGVPPPLVLAVEIRFRPDGSYLSFDDASPLVRNGGKPQLLAARPPSERPLAMVGDGSTDLETQPVVDRFVGFGGVVSRAKVVAGSRYFAHGPSLASVLPFLLTRTEQAQLRGEPRFASLRLE